MLFLCCFLQSCVEEINTNTPIKNNPVLPTQEIITASIYGQVRDSLGGIIQDVDVKLLNAQEGEIKTSVDENGFFQFLDVQVKGYFGHLQVDVPGAWGGKKSVLLAKNDLIRVDIYCDPRSPNTIVFDSDVDQDFQYTSNVHFKFQANSFETLDGEPYNGKVRFFCNKITQQRDIFQNLQLGTNWGIDEETKPIVVKPFYSLDVELYDEAGNQLQLAATKPAAVKLEVSDKIIDHISDCKIMHFNETAFLWDEPQDFEVDGNFLNFEVSHFSNWSLCYLLSHGVSVSGKLISDETNLPVQSKYFVYLDYPVVDLYAMVISGGEFYFPYAFPNVDYDVVVLDECEKEIYRQTMSPVTSDAILDDLIIEESNMGHSNLTINVENCAGEPILNGYAWLDFDDKDFTRREVLPIKNGVLSYNFLNCDNGFNGELTFLDDVNAQTTAKLKFNLENGDINMGSIKLCDTLKSYMEIIIDGTTIMKKHILTHGAILGSDTIQLIGIDQLSIFNVKGPWKDLGKYNSTASIISPDGLYEYKIPFQSPLTQEVIDITEFEPNETNNPYFRPKKLVGTFSGIVEKYNKETGEYLGNSTLEGSFNYD